MKETNFKRYTTRLKQQNTPQNAVYCYWNYLIVFNYINENEAVDKI